MTARVQRRVYGRRIGKPLRNKRADVLETLLPKISLSRDILKEDARLSLKDIFDIEPKALHVEIGFGNGEHLKWIMGQHPDHHFIGAEPFMNGMSAFLASVEDLSHDNLRVLMDDALMVLNSLTDSSVDYLYILNPDPWPKVRHHKRRMVRPENLEIFARILKPGAMLIETTDVDELAEWMVTHTINHPAFEWLAENPQDWKTPPEGWMPTRYETKGAEAGRQQTYLIFKRK